MTVMVGLITTIQVNLVPNPGKATQIHLNQLSLLIFLLLAYHHNHFLAQLAATLDFTSFSQWPSSGPQSWAVLD